MTQSARQVAITENLKERQGRKMRGKWVKRLVSLFIVATVLYQTGASCFVSRSGRPEIISMIR